MKFGPWAPPNCLKIEANGATKTKLPPSSLKVMIFSKFQGFWTSKLDTKIIKIRFENEVEKTLAFGSQIGFWSNFGVDNRPKNAPVGGKWILRKTLFLLSKIKVFQLRGPPKIIKFAARKEDGK